MQFSRFPILPGSAKPKVIGGGIVKRLLIPCFISNISAKNIKIRPHLSKVIASQRWDISKAAGQNTIITSAINGYQWEYSLVHIEVEFIAWTRNTKWKKIQSVTVSLFEKNSSLPERAEHPWNWPPTIERRATETLQIYRPDYTELCLLYIQNIKQQTCRTLSWTILQK